jgi:tetratricopeptide (TPR) repeat protein
MKGLIYIYKTLLFLVFFITAHFSYAQWSLDINGNVKNLTEKSKLDGATISVTRNGKPYQSMSSASGGKFKLKLDPEGDYEIIFSKPGFVSKKIIASTKGIPPEDSKYGFEFPMEMNLFEEVPGLDVSILKQPIGRIAFNPATGYMDYDQKYTESIQKELDRLMKEFEEKMKAQEAERKKRELEYKAAVDAGNKAFSQKSYEEAKSHFNNAAKIKPTEDYPPKKIAEIEGILTGNADKDKKYLDAIAKADKAFNEENYTNALSAYKEAIAIKPSEKYPQTKISEIDNLLLNASKIEKEYNDAITKADQLYNLKDYANAKTIYQKASSIKPKQEYPKNKINEIDALLAKQGETEKNYTDAINNGDKAFDNAKYQDAIAFYETALKIKEGEKYPQSKINEAKILLANASQIETDYKTSIQKADDLLAKKNYIEAKKEYQKASNIKPKEEYPKNKINEIDKTLAEETNLETNYKEAIAKADQALKLEDYSKAKENYEKANALKPNEKYPQDQLLSIEKILSALNKKNEEYNNALSKADAEFNNQKYKEAKSFYETAAEIKPTEKYPKEKIKEIDRLISELAMQEDEKKKIEAKYTDLIKQADGRLAAKEYEIALMRYKDALSIKPNENYPPQKIKEIEDILTQLAKEQDEIKLQQQQLKKQKDAYDEIIMLADKNFKLEDYTTAKIKYEEALQIFPNEAYPKDRISKIDEILKKKTEEDQLAAEAERKKKEYYDALIAKADNELKVEDFAKAKENYQMATVVMPNENYPKQQLLEIERLLKEKQQKEDDEKELANQQKKIDSQYKEYLSKAELSVTVKDYNEAINFLNKASTLKPNETFPPQRIKELQDILSEIKLTQEKNKQLELQYIELIKNADNLFTSTQYQEAKIKYEEASILKEKEIYPIQQIKEIDKILADLALKEKQKLEQDEASKKRQAQLDEVIKIADNLFAETKYDEAKKKFNEALGIIPFEPYALQRIKDIDAALDELKKQKDNELQAAEREKKYTEYIERGDRNMMLSSYNNAKENFEKAIALKPDQQYPKDKIAEIAEILANKNQQVTVKNNANRATITDEKEKQLDKMFEEIWKKNYAEKNKLIEETTRELEETEVERISLSQKERNEKYEEQNLQFKDIEEYNKQRAKENLENSETVYLIQKELELQENNLRSTSEKKRQEASRDMDDLASDITQKQKEQNEWHKNNYEAMKNYENELASENERKIKQNNQKRSAEYEYQAYLFNQIEKTNKQNDERRKENTILFYEEQKEIAKSEGNWINVSAQKRSSNEELLLELANSIKLLDEKKSKMHMANFEKLKEEQEVYYTQEMLLINDADEKRQIKNEEHITLYNDLSNQNKKRVERNKDNIALVEKTQNELIETENIRIKNNAVKREDNAALSVQLEKEIIQKQILANNYHKQNFESLKSYQETIARAEEDRINIAQKQRNLAYNEQLELAAEIENTQTAKAETYMKSNISYLQKFQQEQESTAKNRTENEQNKRDRKNKEIKELAEQIQLVHQQKNKSYLKKVDELNKIQIDYEEFNKNLTASSNEKITNYKPTYYTGEAKIPNSELKGKFPEGVTEETLEEGNALILKRYVVKGDRVDVYQKIYYKWGGVFYTKNGYNITEALWKTETQ